MAGDLDDERHLEGQTDQLGIGGSAGLTGVGTAAGAAVTAVQHRHLGQVLLARHLHGQLCQRHGGEVRHGTLEGPHAAEVLLERDVVAGGAHQDEQ